MSKFTPGPWIKSVDTYGSVMIREPDGNDICALGGNGNDGSNADLIISVHDLLEALQGLIHEDGGSVAHSANHEKCIKARAAIAKATGQ